MTGFERPFTDRALVNREAAGSQARQVVVGPADQQGVDAVAGVDRGLVGGAHAHRVIATGGTDAADPSGRETQLVAPGAQELERLDLGEAVNHPAAVLAEQGELVSILAGDRLFELGHGAAARGQCPSLTGFQQCRIKWHHIVQHKALQAKAKNAGAA